MHAYALTDMHTRAHSQGMTSQMTSQVMVLVQNSSTGIDFLWDKVKFINRVYIMREQYEEFAEGTLDIASLQPDEDPFWDPNDFMVMGYSTVFLKPLAFCLSIDEDYAIYYETQKVRSVCV